MEATTGTSPVKCVVWDLDGTLWEGTLLEGDNLSLRSGILDVITGLDDRGILQSIASKNDHDLAIARLNDFSLAEYFIYPQIHWGLKSSSIKSISDLINIGLDSIAFVDDQAFERDEVTSVFPQVYCIPADVIDGFLDLPRMNPRFITVESRIRRKMYLAEIARKEVENQFVGPKEEFLASLNMRLTIGPARPEDLKRAEELTIRTHQLNTTGYTYSYEELLAFMESEKHELLICELEDKYGTYGKIGLALVEHLPGCHTLKLFLMSCRVMSRGVGSAMFAHLISKATAAGVRLVAEFKANDRNRPMYIAFKFANFREIRRNGDEVLLESDPDRVQPFPSYMEVIVRQRNQMATVADLSS